MKRLTLNETWDKCLEMWKWIAMKVRAAIKAGEDWDVEALKTEWLEKHGIKGLHENCFFCDRAKFDCPKCPGRKVDKAFDCLSGGSCYQYAPIEFYAELRRLNKIRLKGKG